MSEVIYFINYVIPLDITEIQFFRHSIETVQKIFPGNIYIFTDCYTNNATVMDLICSEYDIRLIKRSIPRISIIRYFLEEEQRRVILLDHRTSFRYRQVPDTIYADFKKLDTDMAIKLGFTDIILAKTMIIPYSADNVQYLIDAMSISDQLETNADLSDQIALTLLNSKTKIIRNIEELNILENISYKIMNNIVREPNLMEISVPYNHPDYMFYPYLDINTDKTILNSNTLPIVFNTSGFQTNILNYKLIYRRYGDKLSGLFIKKSKSTRYIPKILNHVWINSAPSPTTWVNILTPQWQYRTWINYPTNKWKHLLNKETDDLLKLIITYLMILSESGGFIISDQVHPIQPIPDDLLTKRFMISYLNEANNGTKLSYRIIGSSPNAPIINKLYAILSSQSENKLDLLETTIISDPDTIIYPSYYFNPDSASAPKKLLKNAIYIPQWISGPESETSHTKTQLLRTYKSSPKVIINKLNENPRDRY